MFGYVVTDKHQLSPEEQQIYKSYYCGLCRILQEKYGRWGQAALNFDMTFLYLLLSSLYESEGTLLTKRCLVHPFKVQQRRVGPEAEYCADMTILLAYYNALDDWHDDHSHSKHFFAKRLAPMAQCVAEQYPRQNKAIVDNIEKINELERESVINLDAVSNCFGALMGELYLWKEDHWSSQLRALGENLGKFIYFMDAYEDAEKDLKHKNYNPLLQIKDDMGYNQKCKEILQMFLGYAAAAFEALPIVENAHIIRNILYAGVWSKFSPAKEKKDD